MSDRGYVNVKAGEQIPYEYNGYEVWTEPPRKEIIALIFMKIMADWANGLNTIHDKEQV